MEKIKLPKLPERTPSKLTINVMPDLADALADYAIFYRASYGLEEPVSEIIPAMLRAFVDGDRSFQKARNGLRPRDGEIAR